MYRFCNPNPKGKLVGDCSIRAISIALNQSWEKTYNDICALGFDLYDMPEGYSQTGPMMYGNSYGMRWQTPEERFARGGYSGQYYDEPMRGGRSYEGARNRDEMGRYPGMEDGYSGRRYR